MSFPNLLLKYNLNILVKCNYKAILFSNIRFTFSLLSKVCLMKIFIGRPFFNT